MSATSLLELEWPPRREIRASGVLVIALAGAVATAVTAWSVAHSPVLVDRTGDAIWRSLFVGSYVAVGAYTWRRRPESRLGPIIAGSGFIYSATSLNASGNALVYTLGMVVWAVYIVYTAYMYLCFPAGRLESGLERRFIQAFGLSTAVLWGLILPLSETLPAGSDFTNCGTSCPQNALQIVNRHSSAGVALVTTFDIVFTIAALGVAMLVFSRARSSSRLRRRTLTPLTVVVLANIAEFVVSLFLPAAFPGTRETLKIINGLVTVAVPAAILAGQVRGDVFAAVRLGQIALREGGRSLTPPAVQDVIADALGDPSLRLALWVPGRAGYVDVSGELLELPEETRVRGVTRLIRSGRPLAALIHDPTLDTDSDVVQGLAATSLLLLENTRLVEELRASRSRIVEAADRERQRLEQDLHDGAQQRLMSIQIKLRMAQRRVERDDLATELESIAVEAQEAVDELRTIAHGIYPTVLRDRGLADALRSLALTATIPIRVTSDGVGRSTPEIEAAIYFCSLEAIQNTIKHAGSRASVTVTLERDRQGIRFSVTDDGVGTCTLAGGDGRGLAGMRDRIGAVGGELEVTSSPEGGTAVLGTVPDKAPQPTGTRAGERC